MGVEADERDQLHKEWEALAQHANKVRRSYLSSCMKSPPNVPSDPLDWAMKNFKEPKQRRRKHAASLSRGAE